MKFLSAMSALAISIGLATPASAITITSISGVWQSADVTAGSISGSDGMASGVGTSSISWGDVPNGYVPSAYSFSGTPTPFETAVDEMFNLGTFTHSNNPIWTNGEMLNGAELVLTFTIDGVAETFQSVFDFTHWETPNEPTNCADGGTHGVGVNANGCADRVTLALNEDETESFTVGGVEYVLDISGFLHQGVLMDSFWTMESAENNAILQASYRMIDSPSEVPLPASGLLLLGGLAGLAMKRRRK